MSLIIQSNKLSGSCKVGDIKRFGLIRASLLDNNQLSRISRVHHDLKIKMSVVEFRIWAEMYPLLFDDLESSGSPLLPGYPTGCVGSLGLNSQENVKDEFGGETNGYDRI